jgi:hypothetical protein
MNNQYYESLKDFQNELTDYVNQIFRVYGNELLLLLTDYNLLASEDNCLESSTAFGYIIEEFLVSKLEIYTHTKGVGKYQIERGRGSTTNSSYDCLSDISNGILALINVKAEKKSNNAIAAIKLLHKDYVVNKPEQIKCYLVLKVHYEIDISKSDNQRKIFIKDVYSFYLEEVDYSKEHKQDKRSWGGDENPLNNGRLQASSGFRRNHLVPENKVSYENTRKMVQAIYDRNMKS